MDADADADAENQMMEPISTPLAKSPLIDFTSQRKVTFADQTKPASASATATQTPPPTQTPAKQADAIVAVAAASVTLQITRRRRCGFPVNINRIDELINIIILLPSLTPLQKTAIRIRYVELLLTFNRRCTYYAFLFRLLRLIVTVGSLLVPALLSVQYDDKYKTDMYWATWVISLAVTTSNGIFTLFKIDKKYYFIHTIRELLISEGWQYISLTGRYGTGGHLLAAGEARNHEVLYPFFCHYIEKIKLKQVEEEYYKGIESNQTAGAAAGAAGATAQAAPAAAPAQGNKLYPLTPDKNIAEAAKNVEESTKVKVDNFLQNMSASQMQQIPTNNKTT
jgi:hypothetical protein